MATKCGEKKWQLEIATKGGDEKWRPETEPVDGEEMRQQEMFTKNVPKNDHDKWRGKMATINGTGKGYEKLGRKWRRSVAWRYGKKNWRREMAVEVATRNGVKKQ